MPRKDDRPAFISATDARSIRHELEQLRDRAREELGPEAPDDGADPMSAFNGAQDAASSRSERERQIALMQAFFNNPAMIDLRDAPITTSTTREELERRRRELSYRVDLIETLQKIFKSELEFLDRVQLVEEAPTSSRHIERSSPVADKADAEPGAQQPKSAGKG